MSERLNEPDERIRNIPTVLDADNEHRWQTDPIFRQKCLGQNQCLWCKLTGYHNQSPLERQQLMKQVVIGIMVLIVLLAILVGAAALVFRMVA